VKIGGLQKITLIDYPQKVACTVFLSGCTFRCSWCYSPELVIPEKIENHPELKKEEVLEFLESRVGKLEGVVICGGEPTINQELPEFIKEIKGKGFLVKLDTNGANPGAIKKLLEKNLVDYIAMDVKAPLEKYNEVTGVEVDKEKIKKSIQIIKDSKIDYEFRTTLVPEIHKKEDIEKIGEMIKGAKKYFLQNFLPKKTINESYLGKEPLSKEEIEDFRKIASSFVEKCEIR